MTIVPTGSDLKREVSFNKDEPKSYEDYENQIQNFFTGMFTGVSAISTNAAPYFLVGAFSFKGKKYDYYSN